MLNKLRSITFFSDAEAKSNIKMHAARFAQLHESYLTGVFRLVHPSDAYTGFARGDHAVQQALASLLQKQQHMTEHVRLKIKELERIYNVRAECRVVWSDDLQEAAVHALYSDVIMIGHPSEIYSIERLLLSSGAPVLVVPEDWKKDSVGERIVLGWNGSHQARRAISDAMPFIANASYVSVVVVNAERYQERFGEDPGADITHYLARHGAKAELTRLTANPGDEVTVIHQHASDVDADMLVIGAYSRARIGQILFGGVTQSLVTNPMMPVLLAR
ncbi:universal stress protein [Pectobacterium cacticida]|uniref:universal stress protein n=1 Tax=Pectobacterium cacticida TaxID=69221 RepID=UPI00398676D4